MLKLNSKLKEHVTVAIIAHFWPYQNNFKKKAKSAENSKYFYNSETNSSNNFISHSFPAAKVNFFFVCVFTK